MKTVLKALALSLALGTALPTSVYAEPSRLDLLISEALKGPDREIAYGPDQKQYGQLWLPKGAGPFPVIILLHGGCWLEKIGSVKNMIYVASDLRKSGYAVWNLEYRAMGETGNGYPNLFNDVSDGIDYVRRLAEPYKLDLTRTALIGYSAGGHLALWAAARGRISKESPLYRDGPFEPNAVVSLAGIGDLKFFKDASEDVCGQGAVDRLIADNERNDVDPYADTSPAALLPLGVAQVIVSGMEDGVVPMTFGDSYGARARALGDKVEILDVPKIGHRDMPNPLTAVWVALKPQLPGLVQGILPAPLDTRQPP